MLLDSQWARDWMQKDGSDESVIAAPQKEQKPSDGSPRIAKVEKPKAPALASKPTPQIPAGSNPGPVLWSENFADWPEVSLMPLKPFNGWVVRTYQDQGGTVEVTQHYGQKAVCVTRANDKGEVYITVDKNGRAHV